MDNTTVTPKFDNVLRLVHDDTLALMLLDGKIITGKIITYDNFFVMLKTEERRHAKITEGVVIVPITSIVTIRVTSST